MAEFWLHPGSSTEISQRRITGNLPATIRDLLTEQAHSSIISRFGQYSADGKQFQGVAVATPALQNVRGRSWADHESPSRCRSPCRRPQRHRNDGARAPLALLPQECATRVPSSPGAAPELSSIRRFSSADAPPFPASGSPARSPPSSRGGPSRSCEGARGPRPAPAAVTPPPASR
jgi:hypothetical protein